MAENPSNEEVESSREEVDPPFSPSSDSFGGERETSSGRLQTSMALDVARMWIEEHQKESMLGAFAVGVFLGGLFRD